MQNKNLNIAIIGGGPVGLTLALSLAKSDIEVVVFDNFVAKENDSRVLALSYASYQILNELKINLDKFITLIKRVHISHSGFGVSNIEASDLNLEYLGFSIRYTEVLSILMAEVYKHPKIKLIHSQVNNVIPDKDSATICYNPSSSNNNLDNSGEYIEQKLTANFVILAEGGKIKIPGIQYKKNDYGQIALIARLKVDKFYDGVAFERFDSKGPLVLIPNDGNYTMVWSLKSELAKWMLEGNNLLENLKKQPFMKRFSKIQILGEISSFSLTLQVASQKAFQTIFLIGSAAQTIHPVSAQGLNLSFRDVRELSQLISQRKVDLYELSRNADTRFVIKFTHILAEILENRKDSLNMFMSAGILGLSNCKLIQNKIARTLIFGMGYSYS